LLRAAHDDALVLGLVEVVAEAELLEGALLGAPLLGALARDGEPLVPLVDPM
jgi:hypothetical protein